MAPPDEGRLRWIGAEDIQAAFLPAPFPPRPAGGALGPMVRSLRELGCLRPIVARPLDGRLQVVCGYRRLLAAQAARLDAVPVIVRELTDAQCRELYEAEFRARVAEARGEVASEAPAAGRGRSEDAGDGGRPRPGLPDRSLTALARHAEACFRAIADTRAIPVQDVEAVASDLMDMAPVEHGRDLRAFCAATSQPLVAHALIVAGLGIHLARSIQWTQGQVKKFSLACLLHDVGMLFVPRELLGARRPLTRAERALVEVHPAVGREIIRDSRAWGAQIHLVAQDHHERWDGKGYPAGKKGNEVDLPSRIVGFLDCFGALVSPRPHREALLYSEAVRTMAALTDKGQFDPSILMHFRTIFTHLPVGSCVRLRDGSFGRVVARDPRNPFRHRVRLLGAEAAGRPSQWVDSKFEPVFEIAPFCSSGGIVAEAARLEFGPAPPATGQPEGSPLPGSLPDPAPGYLQ